MYSLISCVDVREIDLLRVYRKYVEVYRCKCVVDISIHVHNARVVNRTNGNLGQPSNIPRGGRAFAQYIQATSELSSIFPFISFPLIFEKRIDLDYRFFRQFLESNRTQSFLFITIKSCRYILLKNTLFRLWLESDVYQFLLFPTTTLNEDNYKKIMVEMDSREPFLDFSAS